MIKFDIGNMVNGEKKGIKNQILFFQSQITDFRRRKNFFDFELKTQITKTLVQIPDLNLKPKSIKSLLKKFQNVQFSHVKIQNRCTFSGRASTVKKFRCSRIYFRNLANLGLLPGVSKQIHR